MTFRHAMQRQTEGITVTAPLKWRTLDGVVADFWQAEGQTGAGGYYLSPDPLIMIFLEDVGQHIRMAGDRAQLDHHARPMARAMYVPAGMPLWTRFDAPHRFRHLDLHLDSEALRQMLVPSLGRSAALTALRRPVEADDAPEIATLARLVSEELSDPRHHPLYLENLVRAIATGLLNLPAPLPGDAAAQGGAAQGGNRLAGTRPTGNRQAGGGLTGAQMRRLEHYADANRHRRIATAELAAEARLSESWFTHAFKHTTGETPLQWQLRRRIDRAKELLTDPGASVSGIAAQLGFSDQAHFTRVFRSQSGHTPAAWRRSQHG